ncbi:MAG: hypothetical protein HOW59_20880 [Nonomuraea sp.]|nr:hypothetical protein [Nonomuraea sp.]
MSLPSGHPSGAEQDPPRLHVEVSGDGQANVAGGDQHIHYHPDGIRRVRSGGVVDECPYPGLAAFGPEQARWFFGRDELLAELKARLDERARSGGPVMVVAPSGAGKSSLLRAGLVPALEAGAVPGSRHWPRLLFTPTDRPLAALTGNLAAGVGLTPEQVAAGPQECAATLRRALRDRDAARAVVIVDQLEELFTLCADESERRRFVELICGLADPGPAGEPSAALVVCGVRSDFYTSCADHPRLRSALRDGQVFAGPMSQDELREAIVCPAQDVGLTVEPGLAELLLRDLGATGGGYAAGRLPLLAHALRTTWQERHGHLLTVDGYRATGGIQKAVATTAERIFTGLEEADRQTARALFLRLVTVGDGVEDVRRRVARADLLSSGLDTGSSSRVVDAFTHGRLLTQHEDIVEITHEALLIAWPRLKTWIAEDRAGLLVRQDLIDAAASWRKDGEDPSGLLRGLRLAIARNWVAAGASPGGLDAETGEFLRASVLQEESERQAAQLHTRRLRLLAGALAVLLVAALTAAGVAIDQRQTVVGQRDRAASAQVAGLAISLRRTNPDLARRLAVAATSLADTSEARSGLLTLKYQREEAVVRLADYEVTATDIDDFGRVVAAAGGALGEGSVRVGFWDAGTRRKISSYRAQSVVEQVSLSGDGRTAAVLTGDQRVRLLDTGTGRLRDTHVYPAVNNPYTSLSPLGTYLLIEEKVDLRPILSIWDTRRHKKIVTQTGSRGTFSLLLNTSFSPDERVISISGERPGQPFTWLDTRLKKRVPVPGSLSLSPKEVLGPVVFSPDGKRAAVLATKGRIRVFERDDAYVHNDITGARSAKGYVVRFSHDGRYLVQDGVMWEREASWGDGKEIMRYSTSQTECSLDTPFRFSADGSLLRCVGSDGMIRSLNVGLLTRASSLNPGANLAAAAVSADSSTAVVYVSSTLDEPSRIEVWSVHGWVRRSRFTPGRDIGIPAGLVLSRDGRLLAVLSADNSRIEIWDSASGSRLGGVPTPLAGVRSSGNLLSYAISPDGRSLAVEALTGDGDNRLAFWDLATMSRVREFRAPLGCINRGIAILRNDGSAVLFRPDGKTLIAAPCFGVVEFPSGRIITKGSPSLQVDAISPDGSTLYTYPRAHRPTVKTWDARTLRPVGEELRTGTTWAWTGNGTAASHDGSMLATAHMTGSYADPRYEIKLWDTRARTQLGLPLPVAGEVVAMAFTADGSTLVSIDKQGKISTFPIERSRLIRDLCTASGALSEREWNTHIPDIPYRDTC